MQIFFPGRQAAPDMPLGLVHVQNSPGLSRETGIDMQQTLRHILVYRTLTNPELLRRLTHRRIVFYDIIRNVYRAFFDIILQGFPP